MNLITQRAGGVKNMGDAADSHSVARFGLDVPYGLLYVRTTFSEAIAANGADGNATMQLKVNESADVNDHYNFILAEWLSRGLGADATAFVNWRVHAEELAAWVFEATQALVLEWTNPESTGKMRWAVELGLYIPS